MVKWATFNLPFRPFFSFRSPRWGHTPLDDAVRFQRQDIVKYLENYHAAHPDEVAVHTVPVTVDTTVQQQTTITEEQQQSLAAKDDEEQEVRPIEKDNPRAKSCKHPKLD